MEPPKFSLHRIGPDSYSPGQLTNLARKLATHSGFSNAVELSEAIGRGVEVPYEVEQVVGELAKPCAVDDVRRVLVSRSGEYLDRIKPHLHAETDAERLFPI